MTTEPIPTPAASEGITATPPAAAPITGIIAQPQTPTPAAPTPASVPPVDWSLRTEYLLLGLMLILSFFVASFTASNTDLWMHLETGKRISQGKMEFGVDPYLWTTEGVRWVHHSWLYSWLMYQIHQSALGGAGLIAIKAILFTITVGLLCWIGWNSPNRWFLIVCMLMAVLATSSRLFMQPIVFTLLFLAITMFLLHRAGVFLLPSASAVGEGEPAPRILWALPPLFALWANFDAWFILGPMMLGIVWASTGLARWFGVAPSVPGKQLGLVFGVGLLACLVNPHHVHVFQLPPELAHLVLVVTDPLSIPMPAELVAGGRTLKELRKIDADVNWTLSPLVWEYWGQARIGKNIAGLSFFPLVLLGLIGFVLVAMVKPQAGAPSLQLPRFLIWLVFGVMALTNYRMIPYFALIAAPLTAWTLSEFLIWQQTNANVPQERRDRGLRFARFVSVPFVLLLLYLAWPGWLHGSTDYNSRSRVAWQVRVPPSLQKAAETLKELKATGEGNNVYTTDLDLGNVLPWFAPEVRSNIDSRFSLHAKNIAPFGKQRDALHGEKDEADWRKEFTQHQVDQIAMSLQFTWGDQEKMSRLFRWWIATPQWRHRFADKRIAVLSWAGAQKSWPVDAAYHDLNRQAFGEVPPASRPRPNGVPTPTPPDWLSLYLTGPGPQASGPTEIELYGLRYGSSADLAQKARLIGLGALLQSGQGVAGESVQASTFSHLNLLRVSTTELGPPALPVLMVRTGRAGVAENRLDAQAHLVLAGACEMIAKEQEDRWLGFEPQPNFVPTEARQQLPSWTVIFVDSQWRQEARPHPTPLRNRIRQTQQILGAYNALQLQPDNFTLHERVAKHYLEHEMLDLALEHKQLALKGIEDQRSNYSGDRLRQYDQSVKAFAREVETLEKEVKQRMDHWKSIKARSAFEKAILAMRGGHTLVLGKVEFPTSLSLGKAAFETLGNIDPATLGKEERRPFVGMRFELLLSMGRVDLVAEALADENVKKNLPPEMLTRLQLQVAAALGDYESADTALSKIEKQLDDALAKESERIDKSATKALGSMFLLATQPSWALGVGVTWGERVDPMMLGFDYEQYRSELCNMRTLHGILMLEAGDTKKALTLFEQAMRDAATARFFTDRPIAQRYLQLLREQHK